MGWNNRVMRRECKGYDEEWFEIHEVYYDDNDEVEGYTKDAIAPGGHSIEELRRELERMLACLDKPVLDYEEEDVTSPESPTS